jgi:hypothetical protein
LDCRMDCRICSRACSFANEPGARKVVVLRGGASDSPQSPRHSRVLKGPRHNSHVKLGTLLIAPTESNWQQREDHEGSLATARMCKGVIRENAKWRRGSIRVQGEVDGVAWSWAGPSAGYGHFGVGDESPSLALTLWPRRSD